METVKICPSCKGSNVEVKEIRDDNGVLGPGYFSWIVDSYYRCIDCGTRFDDVNNNE